MYGICITFSTYLNLQEIGNNRKMTTGEFLLVDVILQFISRKKNVPSILTVSTEQGNFRIDF